MRNKGLLMTILGAAVLFAVIVLAGCDYGRMYDQDSIKTYEQKATPVDRRSIPVDGGVSALRSSDPEILGNPIARTSEAVERGRLAYSYHCVQCHGPNLDGNGTVGQSFSPLPTDLKSSRVTSQQEGVIYNKIRLGFRRHPALFSTIDSEDAWSVVVYLKALGRK